MNILTYKACATKSKGVLPYIILCLVLAAYSSLYFFNTYPISEGWGINYVELIFQGKIPYRDFYYYLPPLNLLIDAVIWKLSFGLLLGYRFWRLIERAVIYILLYNLLKKYFNEAYALLACVFSIILSTADVYDLFGDYNQTVSLLAIFLANYAIAFAQTDNQKQKSLCLFKAGIIIGLEFLLKQTIFCATFIVYFIALALLCIREKDKNFLKYCICVAAGIIVPIIVAAAYLVLNKAFVPFVEQCFLNVDGKGTLADILLASVFTRVLKGRVWVIVIFTICLVLLSKSTLVKGDKTFCALFCVVFLMTAAYIYKDNVREVLAIFQKHYKRTAILLLCVFFCLLTEIFKHTKLLHIKEGILSVIEIGCAVIFCFVVIAITVVGSQTKALAYEIYDNTSLFGLITSDFSVILFVLAIAVSLYSLKPNSINPYSYGCAFIACSGISIVYSSFMAAGVSSASNPCGWNLRITLPLVLCCLFSVTDKNLVSGVLKASAVAVCTIFSLCCISQKVVCSYSWWGSYMQPMSEKVYSTDIPAMAGIKLSADQKELYETITKAIEENSTEDAVVWGYPHIKIFNILTNRYNMDTFVPVLFYDVVADKYVLEEKELLEKNLPDIVVWEDIPYCIETHETVFRDGEPLKQREIIAMFDEVLPEKYELIATVQNVSVYKLKDGIDSAK